MISARDLKTLADAAANPRKLKLLFRQYHIAKQAQRSLNFNEWATAQGIIAAPIQRRCSRRRADAGET